MGIEDSYSEPHRHYHTGAHIEHCLRQFDRAPDSMEDANAIELALWFHDVEYDPQAPNNEQESAERFRRSATGMMSDDLVEQVYRLIMATIHDYAPQVPDEQYVVDIDLSSFGLPWNEFVIDSRKVRNEFPAMSDREFAQKNIGFLRMLLDRPSVYSTDIGFLRMLLDRPSVYSTEFFKAQLEATARDNMRKQIALLQSSCS